MTSRGRSASDDGLVWYVAYGSNLSIERLQRYLDQCPPVDRPVDQRPMLLPHRLFFASFSSLWGGGCAFIDPVPTAGEETMVTAWLVRRDQFVGILARENRAPDLDSSFESGDVASDLAPGATRQVIDGRYGLLLGCTSPDARPALTFTTPLPLPDETAPSASYIATITLGLVEGHGCTEAQAQAYLQARSIEPPGGD